MKIIPCELLEGLLKDNQQPILIYIIREGSTTIEKLSNKIELSRVHLFIVEAQGSYL